VYYSTYLSKCKALSSKPHNQKKKNGVQGLVLGDQVGLGSLSQECSQPVDEVIFFQVVAALGYVLGQLQQVLHGQR
jgi:hypothetical protein